MDFMATSQPTSPPLIPGTTAPQRPQEDGGGEVVLERVPKKVKPPQMHQVVMLNDDYTPMEFVVVVIQEFFSKDRETATQIMLKIHLDGKAVCGVYTRDVAATKADRIGRLSTRPRPMALNVEYHRTSLICGAESLQTVVT